MKTLQYIIASIIMLTATNAFAQETSCCASKDSLKSTCKQIKTTSKKAIMESAFGVKGSCEMCKTRIENAALIKGVKSAIWDKDSQQITVVYDAKKVDLNTIHNAIAKVGHATDLVDANSETYNKLPACCAYKKGGSSCGHSSH